jgi:polynucleotide 5'-hydroxyl-kinase GRC3/NOL9
MRQSIEKGKTLLIDGPACVTLCSGAIRAFGAPIKIGEHVIVRVGKRIPFEAMEDSQVEMLLGNSASYLIIDEDPIPQSWREAVSIMLSSDKGTETIMVLGGIDSGKTSFCNYLANTALSLGRNASLIDGDLGQSDVGPPGTVGLSIIKKPIVDPFNLKPDHVVFIGVTSPYIAVESIIEGLVNLKAKAINMGSNFIIINTDGWIEGAGAAEYKLNLIKIMKPDFIVAIQNNSELKPIIDSLSVLEAKVLTADVPKNIKKRDRETRKIIRESSYKKYLKDGKIHSYPLSWITVNGNLELKGRNDQFLKKRLEEIVGNKIIYCENTGSQVILVLKSESTLSDEETANLNAEFKKPIKILREGDEKGLLVSLEDNEGRFLGVGTIHCIDYDRSVLKVYTNVNGPASRIHVGRIRLDEKGNEVEVILRNQ